MTPFIKQIAVMAMMIGILILSASEVHSADGTITGKVVTIESSYIPSRVTFQMDTGDGNCAAGAWLTWDGYFHGVNPASNVKATYSQLLAAFLANKTIRFAYYTSDHGVSCVGIFLHIISE